MQIQVDSQPMSRAPTEIVERKGVGHPDTLCDALAEQLSVRLSRYYLEHFGFILHHNVDKAMICAGASRPRLGAGEVTEPIDIFLGGRATLSVKGVRVPVEELAVDGTKRWLHQELPELDVARNVRVHTRIRPTSADLSGLFGDPTGSPPRANDSSVGVGYAPLSALESLVLNVEQHLNSKEFLALHPEGGKDVKVMGIRQGANHSITISRAFIGRRLHSLEDYLTAKLACSAGVQSFSDQLGSPLVSLVNAGDDLGAGAIFLTVTGTSAEAGDDGEVGRGNRANGLITPQRPMSTEALAGKNPVNHPGKLYNVLAREIAEQIVRELPGIQSATCFLVSEIGRSLDDPRLARVQLEGKEAGSAELQRQVREIVAERLKSITALTQRIIAGEVQLF